MKKSVGAMRRFLGAVVVPVWIGAGFADYLFHRRTKIETTSGLRESLLHSLMMLEAGPAVLGGLFLKMNAGAIALISSAALAHELTALWDISYTAPRRVSPAGEQYVHTLLESAPFCAAALAVSTNWDQALALFGRGRETADFRLRLAKPPLPAPYLAAVLGALVLLGAIPHLDELWRCSQAARKGLAGQDTPECLEEMFG